MNSPVHPTPAPAHAAAARLSIGKRIISLGADTTLGRATVNPTDGLLSRTHARIVRRQDSYWLLDLDSMNGTYLNGQRIFDQALLQHGDEIRLGQTVLRFELHD